MRFHSLELDSILKILENIFVWKWEDQKSRLSIIPVLVLISLLTAFARNNVISFLRTLCGNRDRKPTGARVLYTHGIA